jgi:hypothetical protein
MIGHGFIVWAQQGGDQHWIRLCDLRAFILDNTAIVDIRKVDKFWFIDLVTHAHD